MIRSFPSRPLRLLRVEQLEERNPPSTALDALFADLWSSGLDTGPSAPPLGRTVA